MVEIITYKDLDTLLLGNKVQIIFSFNGIKNNNKETYRVLILKQKRGTYDFVIKKDLKIIHIGKKYTNKEQVKEDLKYHMYKLNFKEKLNKLNFALDNIERQFKKNNLNLQVELKNKIINWLNVPTIISNILWKMTVLESKLSNTGVFKGINNIDTIITIIERIGDIKIKKENIFSTIKWNEKNIYNLNSIYLQLPSEIKLKNIKKSIVFNFTITTIHKDKTQWWNLDIILPYEWEETPFFFKTIYKNDLFNIEKTIQQTDKKNTKIEQVVIYHIQTTSFNKEVILKKLKGLIKVELRSTINIKYIKYYNDNYFYEVKVQTPPND